MRQPGSKTTIRDVAAAAGVSAMAVSAVLHGTGRNVKVSLEKAEHIRKIALELRYHPNYLARSLRNHRTQTVGVVFQHFDRLSIQNPYYPQLLNGLIEALFPADYTLALCPKLVRNAEAPALSDGRFDGILWCRPDFSEASVEYLRMASIPVVMMHAPPGTAPGVSTFCADNEGALRLAVDYLAELGHRRIAFVVDPVSAVTAEALARAAGFMDAMEAIGLTGEVFIWDLGAPGEDRHRLAEIPQTALIAFSDHVAGQLLASCVEYGVRVPQERSIVGFDSSPFCEMTNPTLTSIYQPVERMAFEATNHLLDLIRAGHNGEAPAPPLSAIYSCRVDVRNSTAPPPV